MYQFHILQVTGTYASHQNIKFDPFGHFEHCPSFNMENPGAWNQHLGRVTLLQIDQAHKKKNGLNPHKSSEESHWYMHYPAYRIS